MNDAEKENQRLKSALRFVYYFNTNHAYQEQVNKQLETNIWTSYFEGVPVIVHIQLLPAYSPLFLRLYRRTKMPKNFRWAGYKQPPGLFQEFLERCYGEGRPEYNRLLELQPYGHSPRYLTPEELHALDQAQSRPNSPIKISQIAAVLDSLARKVEAQPDGPATAKYKRLNPNWRELDEEAERKRKSQLMPQKTPSIKTTPDPAPEIKTFPMPKVPEGAHLIEEMVLPPPQEESTLPLKPSTWAAAKKVTPLRLPPTDSPSQAEEKPEERPQLQTPQQPSPSPQPQRLPPAPQSNPPIERSSRTIPSIKTTRHSTPIRRPSLLGQSSDPLGFFKQKTKQIVIFMFVGIAIIMALFYAGETYRLPTVTSPESSVELAGTGLPNVYNTLLECRFFRGSDSPPDAQFKSNELINYFAEASALTTVPAQLLAGIARIESPGYLNATDETLSSFECPSGGGALGIMQIQPPGTYGYNADAVAYGASFLTTRVEDLTREDFCDPRKSIIIGAGWILHRMRQAGYTDSALWNDDINESREAINQVARFYHGCLPYGDARETEECRGPYNYGDDLWNSMQSCRLTGTVPITPGGNNHPTAPILPIDSAAADIRRAIIDNFGIEMNGFERRADLLRWAYDRLRAVSGTNFLSLVRGTVVTGVYSGSEQTGCNTLNLRTTIETQELLGVLLIHELGHVIQNCYPGHYETEHAIALAEEGPVTEYARSLCGARGTDTRSEDYAEMVAYYLNPASNQQTACGVGPNPFAGGRYPKHRAIMEKLIGKFP